MMEQLYTDFTSKVLPKVAEGFSMTKDYFLDLFGRYVKFLIVTDALYLLLSLVALLVLLYGAYKMVQALRVGTVDAEEVWPVFLCIFMLIGSGFLIASCVHSSVNLVKDVYIPEVRIYQELKPAMAQ